MLNAIFCAEWEVGWEMQYLGGHEENFYVRVGIFEFLSDNGLEHYPKWTKPWRQGFAMEIAFSFWDEAVVEPIPEYSGLHPCFFVPPPMGTGVRFRFFFSKCYWVLCSVYHYLFALEVTLTLARNSKVARVFAWFKVRGFGSHLHCLGPFANILVEQACILSIENLLFHIALFMYNA